MAELREVVYGLESEIGGVGLAVSKLSDIDILFTQLVMDMNDKVCAGNERLYFEEWHRELRVLSELMRYSMLDLQEDNEKVNNLHRELFKQVVSSTAEVEQQDIKKA